MKSAKARKLTVLLTLALLMLTSCSLLPTAITDAVTGEPAGETNGGRITISLEEYERLKRYEELDQIRQLVENYYYQEPDEEAMMDGANMGMLYGLNDPYTFYYTPEQYAEMWEEDEGNYAGIGIQIQADYSTGLCTVTRVFLDSPALEAGLRKGDVLSRVDDLDVTAANLQEAVNIMRGEVGKTVRVQVLRGDQFLDFVVARAFIHTNYVNSCMLEGDVGYISLYEFSGDCFPDFQKQMKRMLSDGAKVLLIDLRDNPGGWVDDAVKIADLFLDDGIVASLRYRDGSEETYKLSAGKYDVPLVVLVNENSASASEILAGCLQDYDRATLVGTTTYGKGVVQYVLPVGDRGAGLQLTAAQYFTPNGNEVHKVGVSPDVVAEMPEENLSVLYDVGDLSDPQLRQAYEIALEKIP